MTKLNETQLNAQTHTDEMFTGAERDATLDRRLLMIIAGMMLVYSVALSIAAYTASGTVPMPLLVVAIVVLAFNFLSRIKRIQRGVGVGFVIFIWLYVTSSGLVGIGPSVYVLTGYLLVIVLSNCLISTTWAIVTAAISVVTVITLQSVNLSGMAAMGPDVVRLANDVGGTANVLMASILIILQTRGTETTLGQTRKFAHALDTRNRHLEVDIERQDRQLVQRSRYLNATAAVARESAATFTNVEQLMQQVVTTISEQLDFYHVGLFLIDQENTWAVLRAASSEGGKVMMSRHHRLRVGSQGIVGYVAQTGRSRIAGDVDEDTVHLTNPDLPATRSEVALPLVVQGRTLGVLDVQSEVHSAFTEQDVSVLQVLADQVAVTVMGANMLATLQAEMESDSGAREASALQSWRTLLGQGERLAYISDEYDVTQSELVTRPGMEESYAAGDTIIKQSSDVPDSIAIPIRVRGEVVGVINGRKKNETATWSEDDVNLLQALTDQLNIALEGARLYEDSQRRAVRERLVREVTDQMRSAMTWEQLLETAVQQMADTVQAPRAFVQWSLPDTSEADAEPSIVNEEAPNA